MLSSLWKGSVRGRPASHSDWHGSSRISTPSVGAKSIVKTTTKRNLSGLKVEDKQTSSQTEPSTLDSMVHEVRKAMHGSKSKKSGFLHSWMNAKSSSSPRISMQKPPDETSRKPIKRNQEPTAPLVDEPATSNPYEVPSKAPERSFSGSLDNSTSRELDIPSLIPSDQPLSSALSNTTLAPPNISSSVTQRDSTRRPSDNPTTVSVGSATTIAPDNPPEVLTEPVKKPAKLQKHSTRRFQWGWNKKDLKSAGAAIKTVAKSVMPVKRVPLERRVIAPLSDYQLSYSLIATVVKEDSFVGEELVKEIHKAPVKSEEMEDFVKKATTPLGTQRGHMSYHRNMEKEWQHNPPKFEEWDGVSPAIPRRKESPEQPLSWGRASWPFRGVVDPDSAPSGMTDEDQVKRHSAPVGERASREVVETPVAGPAHYKPLAPSESLTAAWREKDGLNRKAVVVKKRGPQQRQPLANVFPGAERVDTPAQSNRSRRESPERVYADTLRLESGFDVTVGADGLVAHFGK